MAFTVSGVATVSDVRDGVSPPTIYLTNENHTFVAAADGDVVDFTGFSTDVQVFVGATQYTLRPMNTGTPTGTQFTIGTPVVPANLGLTVTVNATSGLITISDDGSNSAGFAHGDTINEGMITIPVTVAGFSSTFNRVISISKSIGGNAPIIRISSNTQTVEYDQNGAIARATNIIVSAQEQNFLTAGAVTFTFRRGASGAFSALTGTGITIDSSSSPETALITPTAFNNLLGSERTVTIRAARGTVFDQITIARVNDGAAAITVIVQTVSGSNILKSDTDVVVLRADVYQSGTLLTPGNDWTYSWSKDGTALTSANQAAMTGATQQTGEGFNLRSLRIEGDGIADNMSSLFSVTVTDPT